jgi:hypothetical protein
MPKKVRIAYYSAPLRGGQRSSGASDDLSIECRERAADVAHFGHDHSRIYLCGAARIVIFWRGGLRRALAHSLKSSSSERQTAKFSRLFGFRQRRSTSNYQRRSWKP